jgi:arsenate reductase
MAVTIYHNPGCGTSRNVLQYLRDNAFEPKVVEYLKNPPDRPTLEWLLARMGMAPAQLIRRKGELYESSGLDKPGLSDSLILDAMLEHPILIERPIVVMDDKVALCRPWEKVKTLIGAWTADAG